MRRRKDGSGVYIGHREAGPTSMDGQARPARFTQREAPSPRRINNGPCLGSFQQAFPAGRAFPRRLTAMATAPSGVWRQRLGPSQRGRVFSPHCQMWKPIRRGPMSETWGSVAYSGLLVLPDGVNLCR